MPLGRRSPKLRVVESRICGAGIGFRLVHNGFLGFGLPVVLGAGVGGLF